MKKLKRRYYKVVGERVVRFNNAGHPFLCQMYRSGIKGALTHDEMKAAKKEWDIIQKNLPDTSSFDRVLYRNCESEYVQN